MKNVILLLVGFLAGFLVVEFANSFQKDETSTKVIEQKVITPKSSDDINTNTPPNSVTPADVEVADPNGPQLTFNEDRFDFGQINQGDKVTHIFKFTNTGKSPLIITNAKAGCGCTVPKWPKEPIAPGQTSEIEVAYDSKGKKGRQTKSVTITSNAVPSTKLIHISTEILVPEELQIAN